jgi:aldose 1-epimerase
MSLETVLLHDDNTGSTARILAGFGFNCYSFCPMLGGQPREVLWSVPNFESGQERPSHSGIPILFPFPGRISGTKFRFQGRDYPLEAGDGRGNAIHGFVLNRPWQVIEQSADRVVGRFHAAEIDPSILGHWPADFRLTVAYELVRNALKCQIDVENPDDRPLPWGLGTHPYFRIPLGGEGRADDCRITVPASEYWELEGMLASGKRLPVSGPRDLRSGLPFPQAALDDIFSGLEYFGGHCTAGIQDASTGRRMTMAFDDTFRACVVYNPGHREAICIEPYTCISDAFRLEAAGIDAGARVLEPGQSFRLHIEIRYE